MLVLLIGIIAAVLLFGREVTLMLLLGAAGIGFIGFVLLLSWSVTHG